MEKSTRSIVLEWVLVLILLVGIDGLWSARNATKNASAAPAVHFASPEQVAIFMSGSNEEGRNDMKRQLDAWLKEHEGKVEVTGRTLTNGNLALIASIWYKNKTD